MGSRWTRTTRIDRPAARRTRGRAGALSADPVPGYRRSVLCAMSEVQLERQATIYRDWLLGRFDFHPHSIMRMGQIRGRLHLGQGFADGSGIVNGAGDGPGRALGSNHLWVVENAFTRS
jgi:hypothetical protein